VYCMNDVLYCTVTERGAGLDLVFAIAFGAWCVLYFFASTVAAIKRNNSENERLPRRLQRSFLQFLSLIFFLRRRQEKGRDDEDERPCNRGVGQAGRCRCRRCFAFRTANCPTQAAYVGTARVHGGDARGGTLLVRLPLRRAARTPIDFAAIGQFRAVVGRNHFAPGQCRLPLQRVFCLVGAPGTHAIVVEAVR